MMAKFVESGMGIGYVEVDGQRASDSVTAATGKDVAYDFNRVASGEANEGEAAHVAAYIKPEFVPTPKK